MSNKILENKTHNSRVEFRVSTPRSWYVWLTMIILPLAYYDRHSAKDIYMSHRMPCHTSNMQLIYCDILHVCVCVYTTHTHTYTISRTLYIIFVIIKLYILHLSLSQIETIRLPDQGHMTKVLDSGLESSFILLQRWCSTTILIYNSLLTITSKHFMFCNSKSIDMNTTCICSLH